DQIYRVPPPENACIAEQHRSAPPNERNGTRCCITFIIFFLTVFISLGGVLGGLFFM
ncbi:hypothetical protein A2U01_0074745, partial [Trifolium medium]|nr:hypothetical protein [Trifolium medium]